MDGSIVPKIRTGTDFGTWYGFLVRDLMVRYVVRIFGTDFFGTVRGTDFGPDSNLVRYVVRILVRKNPYRNGFFFGTVGGTDQILAT